MAALQRDSGFDAVLTLVTVLVIAVLGTGLGLAAASLSDGRSNDDPGIQLVRPFHVSPEQDRANHDQANH
jgi:hypothetical protein